MSLTELYTKEAKVWVPDADMVWRCAILLDDYKGQKQLNVQFEDDEQEGTLTVKDSNSLPPLKNPEILIGENDLTSLSYLHEPAVLYNLQVRFCDRNDIYTYCGIVLVAINPYEYLPIYDPDTIQAYHGQDMGSMDPHIFAVAEEAFKRLSGFDEDQSIIVSGESGAGKTVSAKYAMRYFATVCGAEAETQIEKKVLSSNPIMEAIGNAKTTRNDNSSRFGKFIEIGFNKHDAIVGANMRTYLLEKSRVVFQTADERNYHIFYQLCACADQPELEFLKITAGNPDMYFYLNQGEAPYIDGVDDAEEFSTTREALSILGINEKRQLDIFRVLSGILHMGNVMYQEADHETCRVPKEDKHLPLMAELLGINEDQIRMWLCNKKVITATEVITKPLTIRQAYFARDALSKNVYAKLFDWIVRELNKSLVSSSKQKKFIGVLDIYGFETFEINSFEQFCINYANEKLQQQFCLHVFKLEQEEYVKEQIEWSFIDFYDNQPCIDLIEGKLGILDLLDEECKMPRGSDNNWCGKLYDKHTKHNHFEKPRMSNVSFIIHHFADHVEYQMDGFLEKNRDTVLEEQINILKASQFEFIADLVTDVVPSGPVNKSKAPPQRGGLIRPAKEAPKSNKGNQNKRTVGSQFRDSLNMLMTTLFATNPHYIRCIKPNDEKLPFTFDPKRAVQQLRACGVLETVRISAAGYPSRWTYPEFFQRYRVLAKSKQVVRNNMRKTCENILTKLIEDRDKYQFGKTKIFFRAGQVAYLEKLRSDKLRYCGVLIQKHVRGWLARLHYTRIRKTVILCQTYGRGLLARRKALYLRRARAATIIQSAWRGRYHRQRYLRMRRSIVHVQCYARGMFGRRKFAQLRFNTKAIIIQKLFRAYYARKRYQIMIRGFTRLQAHWRRKAAKKVLKQLKVEARSVENVKKQAKQQAKGLENKIIELQQKLDERAKEMNVLREDQVKFHDLKNEFSKLQTVKSDGDKARDKIRELEELVRELRAALDKEKGEKDEVKQERDMIRKQTHEIIDTLSHDKVSLKEQLEKANQRIKELEHEKRSIESAKPSITVEQSKSAEAQAELEHHQKLVKEHSRLQQRFDNLQEEMQMLSPPHPGVKGHRRTPSNMSNISIESEMSVCTTVSDDAPRDVKINGDDVIEDQGYGSGRRQNQKIVKETAEKQEQVPQAPRPGDKIALKDTDLSLVTRLQNKVKELERARSRLRQELDRYSPEHGVGDGDPEREIYDTIKLQELEMENAKTKQDLQALRKSVAEGTDLDGSGRKGGAAAKKFMDQFDAMTDELNRRREECIQLRTLLATRTKSGGRASVAEEAYSGDNSIINEDGELEMAYKTQKDLNKLLENELQRTQKNHTLLEQELRQQVDELKTDNDRQQKLIGQNLSLTPEAKIEATMQHEIIRLTSENLDLREQIDKREEQVKKYKKALKIYARRLKSTEASDVKEEIERAIADEYMPEMKYKEREFVGMYEYRKEDEPLLLRNLIIDLKPRQAASQIPGLPAYIMFMCIRHTDYMNDDDKVRSLLSSAIAGIKKIVKKRQDDVEVITMWLANTCRLLHSLKQYSGERAFQNDNTVKQNEHCLRNFDLSEYRQILSDLAVWNYQGLIKLMQNQIHPMIVGAILEHEAIAGLSAGKPTGLRGRLQSGNRDKRADYSLDSLMKSLNTFLGVLNAHAVDPELVKQVFRQLFYWICCHSLNTLLLRKELCHWSKGMQIRYNISHLEQWMRDNKLSDTNTSPALEPLQPIIQASQLLQARKSESDVASICEMCSRLTTSQIIKMLNLYTPVNEFEERVPISFTRKIQERLSQRANNPQTQTLLMNTKFLYAVTFPFNPSSVGLETIEAPPDWGLGFLTRL